ncbi:unnamed protein product [Echinostoma caproni]|uniref:Amidase domain-containing protein n=1 Tax=Echinostoma caproni TaxID=27848 RepID=A0A183BCU3_9TREM|nr:unnamed protein product [Echinostoma caproni]
MIVAVTARTLFEDGENCRCPHDEGTYSVFQTVENKACLTLIGFIPSSLRGPTAWISLRISASDDYKSSWCLVPGGLETNPIVPAGTLGLSTTSDCPMDATIAQMLNAVRGGHISQALDTLIAFRACILDGKPISRLIHHGNKSRIDRTSPEGNLVPGSSVSTHGKSKSTSSGCRTRCTDTHQGAWCLHGSLYRELLFFTVSVFQPAPINILAFDDQFNTAFLSYRANHCPYLHEADRAPSLVAAACRQMLRPLTLIP